MIDHDSVVPMYQQIVEALQKDIAAGKFESGRKLPTESQLSEIYSVSRITIRRAVDELCDLGMVEKKQGKGTFVCAPKFHKTLNQSDKSFTATCAANGMKAGAKLLEAEIDYPEDQTTLRLLGLEKGEPAVKIVRLRYADEKPIVIETNYFPMEYAYLLSVDLNNDSLYRYLREEKGVHIVPGSLSLRIVKTNAQESKLLDVPRNTAVLKTVGCALTEDGKVLHTIMNIGYGEDFDLIVR